MIWTRRNTTRRLSMTAVLTVLAATVGMPTAIAGAAAPSARADAASTPASVFPDLLYFGFQCQRPWDMPPWVDYGTSHPDYEGRIPLKTDLVFETDRPAAGGFHVTMHTAIPEDHYEIEQQTPYRVIVHLDLTKDDYDPFSVQLDWEGVIAGNFPTTVSVTGPAPGGVGQPDGHEKQTATWTNEPIDCFHGSVEREFFD